MRRRKVQAGVIPVTRPMGSVVETVEIHDGRGRWSVRVLPDGASLGSLIPFLGRMKKLLEGAR